jgi:hypothetical protein
MPISTRYDITRGDTAEFEITISDGNGDPINVTLSKVWFTGKLRQGDSDVEALWTINSEDDPTKVFPTDATSGEMVLILDASVTAALPVHRPVYFDVQHKDAAGKVHTVQSGTIKVRPDITRTTV